MRTIITSCFLLTTLGVFGQFDQTRLQTDSSHIEITVNSDYIIREETFKHRDSIWWSVRYAKDSTLCHEGWKTKDDLAFGVWNEYKPGGVWLNSVNYDSHTWNTNTEYYPYRSILDSIKLQADQIIILKYGQEFFDKNIRFRFYGYIDILATSEDGYGGRVEYLGS